MARLARVALLAGRSETAPQLQLAFQTGSLGWNGALERGSTRKPRWEVVAVASMVEDFAHLKIRIRILFGEVAPNLAAREDTKITDMGPIVRGIDGSRDEAELVQRQWSWPQNKRPVYNFRSDGREFISNRCLIVCDGFYEFTDPVAKGKKRKDKWLFTKKDEPIFCIAGIWRDTDDAGQALAMLAMEPGPDIAPYHDRQIVILEREAWADWL